MAARKSPTLRKLASLPREAGEQVLRTSIWLTESDKEWLRSRFGQNLAFGIRGLIAAAKGGRPRKPTSEPAVSKSVLTVVCATCERPFPLGAEVERVLNAPAYCNRQDCVQAPR